MNSALITLTSDFGWTSPYVAAMKGVISARAPEARLQDLSHAIAPQDVWQAAYFLRAAIPFFPHDSIHVVVVDPEVGTLRAALCITLDRRHILCPDNGLWTLIPHTQQPSVRLLSNRRYWLEPTSSTFHGRDIFAPCAAALATGVHPAELGNLVEDWKKLSLPPCHVLTDRILGQVIWIDSFGNVITNITQEMVRATIRKVQIGALAVERFVSSYGMAIDGELVSLFGSNGHLEIALVNGNAAVQFSELQRGTPVEVELQTVATPS